MNKKSKKKNQVSRVLPLACDRPARWLGMCYRTLSQDRALSCGRRPTWQNDQVKAAFIDEILKKRVAAAQTDEGS